MIKRILSIVLSISLIIAVCPVAFATESKGDNSETNEMVIESRSNYELTLKTEDLENGDSCFYMVENGEIIYSSYVDRNSNTITDIDEQSHEKTVRSFEPNIQNTIARSSSGYIYAGRITYDYYSQGYVMGQSYLDYYYQSTYMYGSSYNISGTYKNLASLAAIIASLAALPAAIAAGVAGQVLTHLSIGLSVMNFLIPNYYVEADEHKMSWKITTISKDKTKYVSGSKYTITHSGYGNETAYENDYYPVSSFSSHNMNLATLYCYYFFPGADSLEVVDWN